MKNLSLEAPNAEELNPSDIMVLCWFCSSSCMSYAMSQRTAISTFDLNMANTKKILRETYGLCSSADGNDLETDFKAAFKQLSGMSKSAHELFESRANEATEQAKDDVLDYLEDMYRDIDSATMSLERLFPEGINNVSKEEKLDRFLEEPAVKNLVGMVRNMLGEH